MDRDAYKASQRKQPKAKQLAGFGSGSGRPSSAFRAANTTVVHSTMQAAARNARRRAVAAAATAGLRREEAESLVSSMHEEEKAVLRMVEDELHRASQCEGLRLAYPCADAAQYLPLFESPRYYGTLLLAWLQSATRALHGPPALGHDFIAPKVSKAKRNQARLAAESAVAGALGRTSDHLRGGGAAGGGAMAPVQGPSATEFADMAWLEKQRGGRGEARGGRAGAGAGRGGGRGRGRGKGVRGKGATAPVRRVSAAPAVARTGGTVSPYNSKPKSLCKHSC